MSKVTVFTIVLLLITVSSYGLYFKRNGHLSTPEDIKSFFDENDDTGDNDDTNGAENDDEELDSIIKIGFMNPLTGPVEQYAAGFTYGAEEAINDLNEIYTDSGYTFELVEVDSGCDGTAAEAAAGALVDNGVWASGGAACSEASMGANAVLSAAGVPMISYASNNPILSNVSDYPDFFRIVPSEGLQAYAVADMMESMGVTSPAILYANFNDERLTLLADAIEKAWGTDNVCQKVGYQDLYATSEITQIADAGCDAIFIATLMHDVPFLLEEIDNQELDVMLFKNNGEAIDDIYYSLNEDTNVDGLYNIESRTATSYGDFEERYNGSGVEGIKQYVLTSYDSIMILGHAAFNFHNAQCETKTNCIFAIGNNYEGSSGLHTFLENGDVGGPGYDICYFTASNVSNIFYECNQYWTFEDGIQSLLEDEECDTPAPYSSSTTTQFELLEEDMLYTGVNASIIPSMTEGDYLYVLYLYGGGGDASKSELRVCYNHTPFQSIIKGVSDSEEIWRTKIGRDPLSMFEFNELGWVEESQAKTTSSVYVTLDSKWGTDKDTYLHWMFFSDRPIEFSFDHPGTDNFGEFRVDEYIVSN